MLPLYHQHTTHEFSSKISLPPYHLVNLYLSYSRPAKTANIYEFMGFVHEQYWAFKMIFKEATLKLIPGPFFLLGFLQYD